MNSSKYINKSDALTVPSKLNADQVAQFHKQGFLGPFESARAHLLDITTDCEIQRWTICY